MAMDSLLATLPAIMQMIPIIMQASQVIFYIFFIWFLGAISMRGFRGRKPFFLGFAGALLTGSLCLVGGSAFAGFIPFLSSGFFSMLQLDMIVAGIFVSILTMISLNLMTHEKAGWSPGEMIGILKRKVKGLEDMLERKARHITESEARKIAEGVMKGYKSTAAKLVGSDYEVTLKKKDMECRVVLDAWDGEVKEKIHQESKLVLFFRDPRKVVGLLMIIGLTAASLFFFEGFSNPMEEMSSIFGMDVDELGGLSSSLMDSPLISQEVPPGCISPFELNSYYGQLQDEDFVINHIFEDETTERTVEENCMDEVLMMLKIDHEGQDVVMAFTRGEMFAYLTDGQFCMCMDLAGPGG